MDQPVDFELLLTAMAKHMSHPRPEEWAGNVLATYAEMKFLAAQPDTAVLILGPQDQPS